MTLHELKIKFLRNISFIDGSVYQEILDGRHRVYFIFKFKKWMDKNMLEEMRDTLELGNQLYGELQNLSLEGEKVYPLLQKYIQELTSDIKVKTGHCLKCLEDNRTLFLQTNERSVIRSEEKDRAVFEQTEDDDFFFMSTYTMLILYAESLTELDNNLNFLDAQIERKSKSVHKQDKSLESRFPPLPECFLNPTDFNRVFSIPQIADIYEVYQDGTYHLKSRQKSYLACIAQRLRDKGKLIDEIKSNQDLAKVFCPYFNVAFNSKHEKQFEPDRINRISKEFIDSIRGLIN